nr:MAG TPA: hypothetical protein [Inoviridae sp.]
MHCAKLAYRRVREFSYTRTLVRKTALFFALSIFYVVILCHAF